MEMMDMTGMNMGMMGMQMMIPMVLIGIALFFAVAALFKWLWNITIPEVFGLKDITYWQGFRLMVIALILFGGFVR